MTEDSKMSANVRVLVCFLVIAISACDSEAFGLKQNSTELLGFQDVLSHLATGYKVTFYVSETDCNNPDSLPGEFHEPFGGSIDFYFQYTDKDLLTAQFTLTKYERNSTGGLVTILKQAFLTEADEAYWMISVLSPDKSRVYSSWSFTCAFGKTTKNNPIRFYADESKEPQRLHSFADIKAALAAGERLWYNAMFFLCQGDVPWTAGGGELKDFDIVTQGAETIIKSSLIALVRRNGSIQSEYIIVTSSLHDNRVVEFEITDNNAVTFETTYIGQKSCFLQTTMPGGTVNYSVL